MIDLYTFTTPNGRKPSILLEELKLPYTLHRVDISKGEQFTPEFIAINPNSKIPAIVDRSAGIRVFESGAILIYLAEQTGRFLPTAPADRSRVMEWLMFQMAGIGPMFGQFGHFQHAAPDKIPYAIERYQKESLRLLGVLDRQLASNLFIADDYSIADMALFPWVAVAASYLGITMTDFPHVQRWIDAMQGRPAVQTGMAILTPDFVSDYGVLQ
jgi:GSH-dependent disulfide-bond oxidoreductase